MINIYNHYNSIPVKNIVNDFKLTTVKKAGK